MSFLGICLQLLLGLQLARIKMMTPSEISLNNVSHQVRVKHQDLQVVVSQEKLRVKLRYPVLSQIKTDQAYQMFQHSWPEQSNTEIL